MPLLTRFLALAALVAGPAWAVPQAVVDALVAPAWLERAGRARPLAVGMEVKDGDRILTGAGARAYLRLAEGSTVRLGEDAKMVFYSHGLEPRSYFKGALDVGAGAFRFTTDLLRRLRGRELSIRVGTVTAGIRGTDVWGKTDAARDLVMLIEGRIEVRPAGGEAVEMAQPLTAFVVPRGAPPLPVEAVAPGDFKARARETEIEAGDGAARKRGKWLLLLGSHADERTALDQYDVARGEGFAADVTPRPIEGGGWHYDVVLKGFPDAAEARKAAARLKAATGLTAAVAR